MSFCFQVCASLKLGGVGGELEVECLRPHLPLLLPVSTVSWALEGCHQTLLGFEPPG